MTDYTEEPKYAAEVLEQQAGPAERSTDTARKVQTGTDGSASAQRASAAAAAAAPAGAEESVISSGVAMGSGKGVTLSVGQGVGPAAGVGGVGQHKSVGQDARHLDAIFAPPRNVE